MSSKKKTKDELLVAREEKCKVMVRPLGVLIFKSTPDSNFPCTPIHPCALLQTIRRGKLDERAKTRAFVTHPTFFTFFVLFHTKRGVKHPSRRCCCSWVLSPAAIMKILRTLVKWPFYHPPPTLSFLKFTLPFLQLSPTPRGWKRAKEKLLARCSDARHPFPVLPFSFSLYTAWAKLMGRDTVRRSRRRSKVDGGVCGGGWKES